MFFSIIVPVYNVAPYLRKCLDSLVGQTCKDKEIILVDDCSTDSSGAICDEYATQYSFVSVIHQENQGLSGARNTGLDYATGEWLYFVDSDDWVELDLLECMQGYILATNVDLYQFYCERVDEQGVLQETKPLYEKRDTLYPLREKKKKLAFYTKHSAWLSDNVWDKIYRHRIIRSHNLRFVDTRIVVSEDKMFNFQYLFYAKKMMFVRRFLYHHLIRKGSLANSTPPDVKLKGRLNLLECFYNTVVQEQDTYFQQNFYQIYFWGIKRMQQFAEKSLGNLRIRKILDEACEKDFHKRNIQELRKHKASLEEHIEGKAWFDKSYGRRTKYQWEWVVWMLKENIKYTLRNERLEPLEYIVDDTQQVAYLTNSKVACTSIRVSMNRSNNIPDNYSAYSQDLSTAKIYTISQQRPFGVKNWFTFSFVRNPFARLVSCYESKYHDDRIRRKKRFKYLHFDFYLNGYMMEDKGFEHFVKQVVSIPHRLANVHFRSQYRLLIGRNGQPIVNFIGKVERLEADYEPIRQKYGFDPLLHYNKVNYGDWRDYYTTKLAKMVYKKYKKDVKYFGYEEVYRDLLDYCKRKEKKNMP